jgi:hypothetical protein
VAGWRNEPDLLVDLCTPCHKVLTSWQYASGINLAPGPRAEIDIARAVLVGCAHLFELFLHRHPGLTVLQPDQAHRVGRYVSMGLDLLADPHREGRWTPDATRTRVEGIRSARRQAREALADWQQFLTVFEHLLTDGALEGGALGTVSSLVRCDPRAVAVIDLVSQVGGLFITLAGVSRQARDLASGLDPDSEDDRVLASTLGVLALTLIWDLQDAQRGRT